jgi:hypothetical protein
MSINCDDNDETTMDYCEAASGCVNVPTGKGY